MSLIVTTPELTAKLSELKDAIPFTLVVASLVDNTVSKSVAVGTPELLPIHTAFSAILGRSFVLYVEITCISPAEA